MFTTLLLILLIIDSFVLVAAILLQAGKGRGMAASFGGVSSSPDAFIGTRQAGNWLTRITWWGSDVDGASVAVPARSDSHAVLAERRAGREGCISRDHDCAWHRASDAGAGEDSPGANSPAAQLEEMMTSEFG